MRVLHYRAKWEQQYMYLRSLRFSLLKNVLQSHNSASNTLLDLVILIQQAEYIGQTWYKIHPIAKLRTCIMYNVFFASQI